VDDFVLPSLGADMEEGTVVEWRVKAGDTVRTGEIVVLVETEKGIIEVEIWEDATVDEILVEEGTTVDVGTPIARIVVVGEDAAPREPEAKVAVAPRPEPAVVDAATAGPPPAMPRPITPPVRHLAHQFGVDVDTIVGSGPNGKITREDVRAAAGGQKPPAVTASTEPRGRIAVSPRARQVAAEMGVDLATVAGTGLNGAITEADVRAGAKGPIPSSEVLTATAAAEDARRAPQQQAAMRRAIARVMARSKREIPHYYLSTTVDMKAALDWLEGTNAERPMQERMLPAVLLLKAAALAVRQVPEVNGSFVDDEFRPSEEVHLGVAISLRSGGLIAPAIHHADRLTVGELMEALRDLVRRTRSGGLRGSEMSDPTITITNLGDRGVETAFPIIYAPQVAMVGFGKVMDRPWAVDGLLTVRPVVTATLAGDHRVSDGHRGGLYLAAVERLLQTPEEL
jgi:pyruvate dehydrogenase E2 component (dihydrolipoamide acetyltransferase)